jgi:hypothetical protein
VHSKLDFRQHRLAVTFTFTFAIAAHAIVDLVVGLRWWFPVRLAHGASGLLEP